MQRFPFELKQFIDVVNWTYAKTMPDWPHLYVVRDKVVETLFVKLVEHFRQYVYNGAFNDNTITYFDDGTVIHWTIVNPIDETTIINLTFKENSYKERLKNGTFSKEHYSYD